MDVILKILLQIWVWQQLFPVLNNIMVCHTVNVCYAVLINDPILVYLLGIQINMQQTRVQQYIFIFNAMYYIVLFMA